MDTHKKGRKKNQREGESQKARVNKGGASLHTIESEKQSWSRVCSAVPLALGHSHPHACLSLLLLAPLAKLPLCRGYCHTVPGLSRSLGPWTPLLAPLLFFPNAYHQVQAFRRVPIVHDLLCLVRAEPHQLGFCIWSWQILSNTHGTRGRRRSQVIHTSLQQFLPKS